MQEIIKAHLQSQYPNISEEEADEQALQIWFDTDDYIYCLDEMIAAATDN